MTRFRESLLHSILSQPSAPFRELHVIRAITAELDAGRVPYLIDPIGNIVIGVSSKAEYLKLARARSSEPLRIFIAHMDHPGFHGVSWKSQTELEVKWHGGSPTAHLEGAEVWLADENGWWGEAELRDVKMIPSGRAIESAIAVLTRAPEVRNTRATSLFGGLRFRAPFWEEDDLIYTKAADDLVGSFAVLSVALDLFKKKRANPGFIGLLTRAEEVGFIGAIGHFEQGWLKGAKRELLCVSLETSRTLPGAEIGKGPVVRLGDRSGVFHADSLKVFSDLAKKALPEKHQRRIMDGGTCEATAATAYGLPAVGISVPLGNYHNQSFEGGPDSRGELGPAPEFVHKSDVKGLLALCHGLMKPKLPWNDPWKDRLQGFRKELRRYRGLLSTGALALAVLSAPSARAQAPAATAARPQVSMTLEQCFQAALAHSDVIASQGEQVKIAEEQYKQAIGSVLPNLSFVADYGLQASPSSALGKSFSPTTQPLLKLTASQPLFRGFREYAGLRYAKHLSKAQDETKRQAEVQVFTDVAQSYFQILSLEQDLRNLATEVQLYDRRIGELRGFVKIGRAKLSEVLTVQASLSTLNAQKEQILGQLQAVRELFAFQTGLPHDTALDMTSGELPPQSLDQYLAHLDQRPDVKAADQLLTAADENVSIAQGAHLPSADVSGNYYFKRYGVSEGIDWDVLFSLSFPIFSGGVIQSRVRQAEAQRSQSELALDQLKRQSDEQIRAFYRTLAADQSQLTALTSAKTLWEKNYQEESREYRLGLVTNIDVLTALTSFQESVRARDRVQYSVRLDREQLSAASGELAAIP